MKKTILRIVACLLVVAIAFGVCWLISRGLKSNAEPTPDTPLVHTHEFGEWSTVVEPTCTSVGLEIRACGCGEFVERKLPLLDHTFGDWQITIERTCTEVGEMKRTCTCGFYEKRMIQATGHMFGEWSTFVEPTCADNGVERRQCMCGLCEERGLDALGHNYIDGICNHCGEADPDYCAHSNTRSEITLAETCTSTGTRDVYCEDCGEFLRTETIPTHAHTTYNVTISEATCTDDGTEKQYCSECNKLLFTFTTIARHEYVDGICSRCGRYDPSIYPLTATMKYKVGDYSVQNPLNNRITYAKLVWTGSKFSFNSSIYFGATFTRSDGKSKTIGETTDTLYYTVSTVLMDLSSEYSSFFTNGEYTVRFRVGSNWSNPIKFTYNKDYAYYFTITKS